MNIFYIEKYPGQKPNEKILNPVWHVHNGSPPKEKIVMPFSMLLNIVGSSNAKSKDVLWKFIKKFHKEIDPKNHKILDELTNYAINYFVDEVEPKKKFKKPNKNEKKARKSYFAVKKSFTKNSCRRNSNNDLFNRKREWL